MAERTVIGRYRLTGPLGRGGMGAVWRAHDTLLDRDVALKEIWLPSVGDHPVDAADPQVRRALREAKAAARLRHPGIITVHDVVTDQGRPWIVMELIDGRSLADAIHEVGLLTEQRTAEVGLQILDALRAAHQEGIAHRDVKPANILLDNDRVVLTDFGIAAIEDATALTATGQVVGSPAFLAPERINGQPATAAADLWALGVTLYLAVTGKSPFQREDTQATLAAILHSQPTTPAHAGQLWPVIKGLLIKDPVGRLRLEAARDLLAKVAQPGSPNAAAAPARRPRWWPAGWRADQPDGGPAGTVVAPSPTLAAPTAHQERAAAVPTPRKAHPAGRIGTQRADPGDTTEHHDDAAETVAAPTVAAVDVSTEPVALGQADTETLAAGPAVLPAPRPVPVPLAPYPPALARPRTARTMTVWLAGLAVTALLLTAGGLLRAGWLGSNNDPTGHNGSSAPPSGRTQAIADTASGKPTASPSVSLNPLLEQCLVGTWRMTSMQTVGRKWEGVAVSVFTSTGGAVLRVWPNGRSVENYSKMAPLTATITGAKYVETLRGEASAYNETKGGRLLSSDFSDKRVHRMTRNGRAVSAEWDVSTQSNLLYTCSDTKLTIYGDEHNSTQSYQRVSREP